MNTSLELARSPRFEMPYIDEAAARQLHREKGWSLSYAYYFAELRDVYLALKTHAFRDVASFTEHCLSIRLPYQKTGWNPRRLLEQLNALRNFSLVDGNHNISRQVFSHSAIGAPLSGEDLAVFRDIYFTYFRFKEMLSWFLGPTTERRATVVSRLNVDDVRMRSEPMFAFSESGRFTDSFLYELRDNTPVYYIRANSVDCANATGNEDLMRFWDVFVKWGTELAVIEKFSLRCLGFQTSSGRSLQCYYVINGSPAGFDLMDYLRSAGSETYIYLPELVFNLAVKYRLPVAAVHRMLFGQYEKYREQLSLERTSEIFVTGGRENRGDKILFPMYNDSYISHMVVRK
jgi:hypothetical protein